MVSYRVQATAVALVVFLGLVIIGYEYDDGGLLGAAKMIILALVGVCFFCFGFFCFTDWLSNGSVRGGEGTNDGGSANRGAWDVGSDWGDSGNWDWD